MIRHDTLVRQVPIITRDLMVLALLLAIMFLVLTPRSGHSQELETTTICLDFSDWKEGEVGIRFEKDSFEFISYNREPLFVGLADTPGGPTLGLQIPEKGVGIGLPQPVSRAILRYVPGVLIPLEITAFNSAGEVTDKVTAPFKPGVVHTIEVYDCARIDITGGGNEAILTEICIEIGVREEIEAPLITGVDPVKGRCGSEITLTVFGTNFEPWATVFIPEGVETIETVFISPEELQARIFIAEDALPGPRPVEIIHPETRSVVASMEAGLTVVCPDSESQPDLILHELNWEIVEGNRILLIWSQVTNAGDTRAPEAIIYAECQTEDWWNTEAIVPALNSGSTVEVLLELEIPDELRGGDHFFRVTVDPWEDIPERNDDNNTQSIRIWIPEIDETDDGQTVLLLTIVLSGSVIVAGTTVGVRHSIKVRRHKEHQDKAREEKPEEPCQPCTYYCRKVELKLEPAGPKIINLVLGAKSPVSSEQEKVVQVQDKIVDGLNKTITKRRKQGEIETSVPEVAYLAKAMLQQIKEWLVDEPGPRDVSITGRLERGKATCQFILYHCRRRGNINVWEEGDKWEATLKDKRDEKIGILPNINISEPIVPERVVSELTQLLVQFIDRL